MAIKNWFRREIKENPAFRSVLALFGVGSVAWTGEDYFRLIAAGYKQGTPVYGCVKLIVGAGKGIVWNAYEKTSDGALIEKPDSPLRQRLLRPNPGQSGASFMAEAMSYYLLAGNSFTYLNWVSEETNELWNLRPDRTKVLAGSYPNLVGGFRYQAGGVPVLYKPEEILHLKEFHPLDDFYGLSPLIVAMKSIDISNASKQWNYKMISNDMRPPMAVVFKESLTQAQRDSLRSQIEEKYAGSENARRWMMLEGGADVKTLATNAVDMDWLNSEKFNLRNICTIFGVASELLGDSENKTYSNIQEARKALYMETVLPMMDMFRDEFNNWLVPRFGDRLYLDYDRDKIEAIQEDRGAKYTYINGARFLTVNEKREALGYEEVEGGDVILVGISEIPLEQAAAEPESVPDALKPFAGNEPEPKPKPGDDEPAAGKSALAVKGGGSWAAPERKRALWDNFVMRVKAKEKPLIKIASDYLKGQAGRVGAVIGKCSTLGEVRSAKILDVKQEAEKFAAAAKSWAHTHFVQAGEAGMRASKGELFTLDEKADTYKFQMTPEQLKKLEKMIVDSGTAISEKTMLQVKDLLLEGINENMTVEEFRRTISERLDEFSVWRARLIARSESAKVENWGQVEGYKQTEFVTQKGWICQMLETSRDAHIKADDQVVNLDDDFDIDGTAMAQPGDPRGGAGNVCNCLCNTYPVVGD